MATTTYTYTSNNTWICPPGVSTVYVQAWAGGGGGAGRTTNGSGGGGGGGAFSSNNFTPVGGTTYTITIGAAGAAGSGTTPGHGGNSSFNSAGPTYQVRAEGGRGVANNTAAGGAGGAAANGTGDYKKTGGTGNTGGSPSANNGGGGGSGAGNNGDGLAGTGNTGGGNGSGTLPGGAGAGGNGAKTGSAVGTAGSGYGGGGGGATRNSSTSRAGAAGAAGAVILSFTTPLIGSLKDNFDDNAVNTALWTTFVTSTGTVTETGGRIVVTPPNSATGGNGLQSITANPYDLTGSGISVRVIQLAHSTTCYTELMVMDAATRSHAYIYRAYNGNLVAVSWDLGDLQTTAYNVDTMRYWRIRESGGTVYWDYSADGDLWTNQHSAAVEGGWSSAAVLGQLRVYEASSDATPGAAIFDNFNIKNRRNFPLWI